MTVRTCWTFFQASHPDFTDILLPEAEADLLTYGSRVAINWGSNNYPMGHHMYTSLATGHISLKTQLIALTQTLYWGKDK